MTDEVLQEETRAGSYVTEVVTEEVAQSGHRRIVLSVILILLIALLVGLGYYAWKMTVPTSKESIAAPEGTDWIRSIYAWGTSPATLLRSPVAVTVAPDGTIWTISNKSTLVGFSPNGTVKNVFPFASTKLKSIEGMDVDSDGNLYLADFGLNKIHVVNPSGKIIREWGVQLPMAVAVRGDRVAVAAAYGAAVFSADGELISKFSSRGPGPEQVDLPHGIVWTDDGRLLISDTQNRRVKLYASDGRLQGVFPKSAEQAKRPGVEASEDASASAGPFQLPAGMTRDAAGRVLLVDPFEFAIIALDPKTGKETDRWGEYGVKDGELAYPTGIAYDRRRDYYVVADTANNRLQVIRIAGSGGNALPVALASAIDNSYCILGLPLLLLVAAVLYGLWRRRRDKAVESNVPAEDASKAGVAPRTE